MKTCDKFLVGWGAMLCVGGAIFVKALSTPALLAPQVDDDWVPVVKQESVILNKAADGHFYAIVTINGVQTRMPVDTGATSVALSYADARRVGLNPQALRASSTTYTANGMVRTADFVLPTIFVEGYALRNVAASCCVNGESLLGMAALSQLRVSMINNTMMLAQ